MSTILARVKLQEQDIILLAYGIALLFPLTLIIVWQCGHFLVRRLRDTYHRAITKSLVVPLSYRRWRGSLNITRWEALLIVLYVAANVAASSISVRDLPGFAGRTSLLACVNLVPLFAGGRTSLIVDRALGIRKGQHELFHKWLGRIFVVECIIHGSVLIAVPGSHDGRQGISATTITLIVIVPSIAILSFLFIRRRFYEFFLKSHLLLALILLVVLWIHIDPLREVSVVVVLLAIATVLWAIQITSRLIVSGLRNMRNTLPPHVSHYELFNADADGSRAVMVSVTLGKPRKIAPNQYAYLTIPQVSRAGLGWAQSHPYMIIRDEIAPNGQQTWSFLIEERRGFSQDLRLIATNSRVRLDGPYGNEPPLYRYDKVLLLAEGIGICGHLLGVQRLLEQHQDLRARTRRVSLIWQLRDSAQEAWIDEVIQRLHTLDTRQIFTLVVYRSARHTLRGDIKRPGHWYHHVAADLDISWVLDQEWQAEAGNMIVSVCGGPEFDHEARRKVSQKGYPMCLTVNEFEPEAHCAMMQPVLMKQDNTRAQKLQVGDANDGLDGTLQP